MMMMLVVITMILMRMISIRGKKYILAIQTISLVVFSIFHLQGDTRLGYFDD